jgi:hypothetical protein
MVVDWTEMLEEAGDPFELAIKLRDRYAQEGLEAPDSVRALPMTLKNEPAAAAPAPEEVEFL